MAKKLIGKKNSVRAQRQKKIFYAKVSSVVILLGLLCTLFVWILNRETFLIQDISVKGVETMDSAQIIELVRKGIEGERLWLFPKKSVILYPEKALLESVYMYDRRIKEVEVSVSTDRTLEVILSEREPRYMWCDDVNQCVYVDENGYLYRNVSGGPSGVFIVLRGAIEGDVLGQNYKENDFGNIKETLSYFEGKHVVVKEVLFDPTNDYVFKLDTGTVIYIDYNDSVFDMVSRLDIFMSQNLEAIQTGFFETVDVRFGKKIFFTEKEKKGDSE